jgi:hypothetical protein
MRMSCYEWRENRCESITVTSMWSAMEVKYIPVETVLVYGKFAILLARKRPAESGSSGSTPVLQTNPSAGGQERLLAF